MSDPIVCQLCGHPDKRDLGTSLAHWRDAPVWPGRLVTSNPPVKGAPVKLAIALILALAGPALATRKETRDGR